MIPSEELCRRPVRLPARRMSCGKAKRRLVVFAAMILTAGTNASLISAQNASRPAASAAARAKECPPCSEWNAPQKPFRLFGNAWYVGTHGLSAVLLTSAGGHVLIDGGLPESAPLIAANIASLGFRIQDVKVIVNSHDHYDHAGGIAELARLSGARVFASAPSARVLQKGESESDDPQFGVALSFPAVPNVSVIGDGAVVKGGDVSITARFTPGHTPGGTTWTWKSCEGTRCLDMVFADSQSPISADDFLYSRSKTYPNGVKDFEKGFAVLESLSCDVLITPHPDQSDLWKRQAARDGGNADALIDATACKRYANLARQRLATRLATEAKKR